MLVPVPNAKFAWRQRGYNNALFGRDVKSMRDLAERAGDEAVKAYDEGVRTGMREKNRREEGAE